MTTQTTPAKSALIFGGGRGMGAAAARALRARGWNLTLSSPSTSCETLAAELGGQAHRGTCESREDIEAAVATAKAHWGRIDGLFLHTGGPPKGDLLDLSDEDWDKAHRLVILSLVRSFRAVVPIMQEQGGGSVVAITSFSAVEPSLIFPTSSAVRAAASAIIRMYAERFGAENIRFNCILPGYIDSLAHKPETATLPPLKRIGKVSEIGETAAFLLSEESGYITGQSLRVDGGLVRSL